jgi:hypothetical protein
MKLSMLTLAIAGPALFVCAPPAAFAQVCSGGNLNNVPFVEASYDPATNATPTAVQSPSVPNEVETDLKNAFSAASSDFQYKLCGLDGIFVDASGCSDPTDPATCNLPGALVPDYSWGLRTYPPNPQPGKRYIALSLALWNNRNSRISNQYNWQCPPPFQICAAPFSLFYKAFIDTVIHLQNTAPYSLSVTVEPDEFASSSAASVLAVLAHEFGHVYWFDRFVPNPGGPFVNNFCGGIFYPSGNWEGNAVMLPFPNTTRFVLFGDTVPYTGSYVPGLPSTLHNIHRSGNWASTLAAFSANEDFVETFELKQLLNAQYLRLTRLQINSDVIIPAPPGSWLDWKLGCVF